MVGQARPRRSAATLALAAVVLVLAAAPQAAGRLAPEPSVGPPSTLGQPIVRQAEAFAISKPLRVLAADIPDGKEPPGPRIGPHGRLLQLLLSLPRNQGGPDPIAQRTVGTGATPELSANFDGVAQATSGTRPIPPDANGEIGPNHFVQMVNVRYGVFDRSGRPLIPPVGANVLFAPLGDVCGVTNEGDPVVVYDQLADRWILSQFGFVSIAQGPYYECIAISRTGDPTGEYYLYAFEISDSKLNDYPKLGVWPDGYYMSVNQFAKPSLAYSGAGAVVFERDRMLAGDPAARLVYVDLFLRDPNLFGLLPSDLDGRTPPPAGAPNPFVGLGVTLTAGFLNELRLFRFHVDWTNPAASTFTGPVALPVAPYDAALCAFALCIPQAGTFQKLDTLSSRLMYRLAYRNFGDHESLVVNHSVDIGGDHAGVRWYEIRKPAAPVLYQQGTYAPDDEHRWMGSIAMDGNGNVALGYSVSSATSYPSIRFTGRLADDPLGTMTLAEGTIVAGSGAQTHPAGRWGDYTDMTVDPLDDCTFWYTSQYLTSTAERDWRTRVAAFSIPGCDATSPTARARAAIAAAGAIVRLGFTTADNSGETRERVTIFRPNGKRLKQLATPLGPDGSGSVSLRTPKQAGVYRWCVVAEDAKGNESEESCARLRVR
jgi:hypothetical protein